MKKLLLIYFTIGVAMCAFAKDEKPFLVKTFKAASISDVEVATSSGAINVSGGSESEARVEVYVRSNNGSVELSKEEIEQRLENYILQVQLEGNTLLCKAKAKERIDWKKGVSISFKLFVPRKVAVNLSTSGGGITLKNLKGDLQFTTSGGGLTLTDLAGTITGNTSGGGITLTNCDDKVKVVTSGGGIVSKGCDGEIELKTSGGSILVEELNGYLKATTSGGGVVIKNARGEIYTSTSGGSMDLQGIKGNISASTSAGGIRADILHIGDFVKLSSSAGSVVVNLPNNEGMDLELRGSSVQLQEFTQWNGKKERNSFYGSVNGGGAKVQVTASAGNVLVK